MRFFKWLLVLVLLLLIAAAAVAWSLPAKVAWRYLGPRVPSVQLADITGPARAGHAGSLTVAGQALGAVSWEVSPLALLHGDARVALELDGPQLDATGVVTRQRDGLMSVHGATVDFPGSLLGQMLQARSMQLGGRVHLEFETLEVRHSWPVALRGHGQWTDATLRGSGVAELGTIHFEFREQNPPEVTATVEDGGDGPVLIDGLVTATPAGYEARAVLRVHNINDLRTQEALSQLGPRQADGSVVLTASGRLLPAAH